MKMYPRAKVRLQEQEDNCSPESDGRAWEFLKFLESLYFEEEKKQSISPSSIPRNTRAYPQHITARSTAASGGISKSCGRKLGEVPKSTTKNARASSVPRPRAVLSSPENDGIFASTNELKSNRSSTQRKRDAAENVGAEAKVLVNQVKAGRALNRREAEACKGKTILKAKCASTAFHSEGGIF